MHEVPGGGPKPFFIRDREVDLCGWDVPEMWFSSWVGLRLVESEVLKSSLHSFDLAHLSSNVVWVGKRAFMLGVS